MPLSHVETLEASAEAVKYNVPPYIHPEDLLYQFHMDVNDDPDPRIVSVSVTEYYFLDGDRSAQILDGLVGRFHPEAASRRLALREFASGYGCVSRHLREGTDNYDLVACDIHPQAIDFMRDQLDVTTHGHTAHVDVNRPALDPEGCWFAPMSEQKDLPKDEYGCMIVTPFYVMQRIARCMGAAVVFFQEAFWWGKQDVLIVRKVSREFC